MKAQPAKPFSDDPGYVCRRLSRPPELIALHARFPERYPHLLASAAHGTPRARYDILFAFPGTTLALRPDGTLAEDNRALGRGDFLEALDRDWRARAVATTPGERLPFTGGWFLFLGYETVGQIEPTVTGLQYDPEFPVAFATRFPAAVMIDHARAEAWLMCETDRADDLLPQLERDVLSAVDLPAGGSALDIREDDPQRYLTQVRRVQEYIRAGDVFQVNLSRRWHARVPAPIPPAGMFRRLCAVNPAPFAGLLTWGARHAVISSSPERLVALRDGVVHTRPIAGTYPRSRDSEQDRALARDLLQHPKERAEHVMLIDLERNDLGRVCRTGSVQVGEFMTLESYPHVHHIVSEVRGVLRDSVTPAQVIRAVFPGGTITGCPKVRCMQIIAELEQAARGAYTGAMGYLNRDGDLDLNILIRSVVHHGRTLSLRTGAGIVADSVPERELAETRAKAKGMLAALGLS